MVTATKPNSTTLKLSPLSRLWPRIIPIISHKRLVHGGNARVETTRGLMPELGEPQPRIGQPGTSIGTWAA